MNYHDVEMLNNSMRYTGETFRQNRLDKERLKQSQIENELRERGLSDAEARTRIADERTQMADQAGAQSAEAKALQEQQKADQEQLSIILKANAEGQIKDYDAVNKWLREHPRLGAIGLQIMPAASTQKPFTVGAGGKVYDPSQKGFIADNPSAAAASQQPMVTEEFPAEEGTPGIPATPPAKKAFMGIDWLRKDDPGSPGSPGIPAKPKRTVRRPPTPEEMKAMPRVTPGEDVPFAPQTMEDDSRGAEEAEGPKKAAGTLTPEIAKSYLTKFNGDRAKAEQAAKQDGYVW